VSAARGLRSAAVVALLALCASAVHAETAPPDSLLDGYVRSLSDSTDAWFGSTAAPLDTAGLDSALAAGLARAPGARGNSARGRRGPVGIGFGPALGFNRADGGQLGASATLRAPWPGRLSGEAQYTTGTHDLLGEGAYMHSWGLRRLRSRVELRAAAGRWTEAFDRDHYEPLMSSINALAFGGDRHQYLRRDGWKASMRFGSDGGFLTAGWRDQLESALPYTTDWVLFGGDPTLAFNLPAAHGRAREWSLLGDVTIPRTRFRVNAGYWTSDPRMGSDFTYRRHRLSAGGDVSLGRHLALVPQATYGRLRGEALPQDALFVGGVYSLRTFERNELAGSGNSFGRVDLVLVDDLRELLHLPMPAWLPLQASAFAASGAAWGRDPVTGAAVSTLRDAPRRDEWRSEAGFGLSWRPGLPDPTYSLRVEYALPIGPDERDAGITMAFQRVLNLLPAR
jgi:hypothetical protein